MNLNQLDELFTKIRVHRPKFGKLLESQARYNQYRSEWYRILKDYDYQDVINNLEKWLSDSENKYFMPDVYVLIGDIYTISEKNKPMNFKIMCKHCKKWFLYDELRNHEDRCGSIEYVVYNYKKIFNKELSRETLWNLNQEEFEEKYYSSLELFLKKVDPNSLEYKNIKNILSLKNGGKALYSINGEEV
jgi:hypothetical protein